MAVVKRDGTHSCNMYFLTSIFKIKAKILKYMFPVSSVCSFLCPKYRRRCSKICSRVFSVRSTHPISLTHTRTNLTLRTKDSHHHTRYYHQNLLKLSPVSSAKMRYKFSTTPKPSITQFNIRTSIMASICRSQNCGSGKIRVRFPGTEEGSCAAFNHLFTFFLGVMGEVREKCAVRAATSKTTPRTLFVCFNKPPRNSGRVIDCIVPFFRLVVLVGWWW